MLVHCLKLRKGNYFFLLFFFTTHSPCAIPLGNINARPTTEALVSFFLGLGLNWLLNESGVKGQLLQVKPGASEVQRGQSS